MTRRDKTGGKGVWRTQKRTKRRNGNRMKEWRENRKEQESGASKTRERERKGREGNRKESTGYQRSWSRRVKGGIEGSVQR